MNIIDRQGDGQLQVFCAAIIQFDADRSLIVGAAPFRLEQRRVNPLMTGIGWFGIVGQEGRAGHRRPGKHQRIDAK